ncbi:MAG: SMC-Scp complex subunit ScpB [Planctomycetota bacterium]
MDEERNDPAPEIPEAGPEGDPKEEVATPAEGESDGEPEESLKKPRPGKGVVEALLFAAEAPLSPTQLASLMGKRAKATEVRKWVKELAAEYKASGRAFHVVEIAGGFRLMTRPAYFAYVKNLLASEKSSRLSEAALDTLAVVAYKQPILKADINQIRGVESGPILKALVEKGLVRAVGRAETLGRPILYGTARRFLDHFGLKSLKELPKLEK